MTMSKDMQRQERQEIWVEVVQSVSDGDMANAGKKIQEYYERLEKDVMEQATASAENSDVAIRAQRGERLLTSGERKYYDNLIQVLSSKNYKQELTNADITIPETVITSVFDDIRTARPILDEIDFRVYPGNVRFIVDKSGRNKAQWGKLCDDIVKELALELDEVDAGAHKLSAFIFICKPMLALGAEWLDRYVREHLRDALEAGLEEGYVSGTGVDMPIGMDRDMSQAFNPETGYVKQTPVALASFAPEELGPIMQQLATNEAGRGRKVDSVFLAYNPADHYTVVFPATHILTPTGYINIDPFGVKLIQSEEVAQGEAILGVSSRYLGTVAANKDGQIEYSDHYKFLEDDRTYIIKLLGNGAPKDKVSFKLLDISGLAPFITPNTGGDVVDPGA